jgi:hypothetical protein
MTPRSVSVEGEQVVDTIAVETIVNLTGIGTVKPPTPDATIELVDVTISAGSDITASHLVVADRIALEGNGQLAATEGDQITLHQGVTIEVAAVHQQLPRLDLGNVGEHYDVVPS